jgi:hypothetical protein
VSAYANATVVLGGFLSITNLLLRLPKISMTLADGEDAVLELKDGWFNAFYNIALLTQIFFAL